MFIFYSLPVFFRAFRVKTVVIMKIEFLCFLINTTTHNFAASMQLLPFFEIIEKS